MNPCKYIIVSGALLVLLLLHGIAIADMEEVPDGTIVNGQASVTFGYQFFNDSKAPNRAAEYRSLTSSPTFSLNVFNNFEDHNFRVDANFLSDEDFDANVEFNKGSLLLLKLRTERFFHNLDHIPYDNGYAGDGSNRALDHAPATGSRPDAEFGNDIRTYYTDHNPNAEYGQKIDINEVKARAKLPTYPAHLNISYWQLKKTGKRQMRFVDENCTGCHMQSRTRQVDRVTNELKGSIDGHFGYIDLEAITLYREFKDNEPNPVDTFGDHNRGRSAGSYDHAEDPESTVKEFTLRANTSPSGGLVGSASVTFGERENKSNLNSISPIEAETDYLKTSADVTYTPNQFLTISLRHRYLDFDTDNSNHLTLYGSGNPNALEVRDSIDFTRAWYEIIGNYRPSARLTIKAELRREDIDRSQTGPPAEHHSHNIEAVASDTAQIDIDPYWDLPKDESITKFKVGFHSRLLEKSALKLSGWASIKRNNDPSYGTSYSNSQEIFLAARYSSSAFWGLSASLDLLDEKNDNRTVLQFDSNGVNEFALFDLDRDKTQQNISLAGWFFPTETISTDFNYGYMATQMNQDLLFGADANTDPLEETENFTIENNNVDYEQTVHSIAAGANWQILSNLSCRVEGHHIRSKAHYDPDFATVDPLDFLSGRTLVPGTASSNELKEISEIDIRQNGIKGRLNWQIDKQWSCSVEASYDDYDDKNNNVFDGSVTSYMASLSRTW